MLPGERKIDQFASFYIILEGDFVDDPLWHAKEQENNSDPTLFPMK